MTVLPIFDNLNAKDTNNRDRGNPFPLLGGGVFNYTTGQWTSGQLVVLQHQWWNSDSFFTQSTWTESKMAAAAAQCANASMVIWDLDNEAPPFYTDAIHVTNPTTLASNRQFVFDIIDELRSRCPATVLFGYYAALPFKYYGILAYSEDDDTTFHNRAQYTAWTDANDGYLDDGFASHFDFFAPEEYAGPTTYSAGYQAAHTKRFGEELGRLTTASGLPGYAYIHSLDTYGTGTILTREQALAYLKGFEQGGYDGMILYYRYNPGSGFFYALRDFIRMNRQSVRTKTYTLFGDSQYSANNLSLDLQRALHSATRTYHWREQPAKLISATGTVASRAAGITAELAAVSILSDEVLINIGGYDLASMPDGATWRANLGTILDALHVKSNPHIYVAYPWQSGYDTEAATMAGWIDTVLSTRSQWAEAGIDIKTAINGHTSGADPDATGTAAIASAWTALLTA